VIYFFGTQIIRIQQVSTDFFCVYPPNLYNPCSNYIIAIGVFR